MTIKSVTWPVLRNGNVTVSPPPVSPRRGASGKADGGGGDGEEDDKREYGEGGGLFLRFMSASRIPQRARASVIKAIKGRDCSLHN